MVYVLGLVYISLLNVILFYFFGVVYFKNFNKKTKFIKNFKEINKTNQLKIVENFCWVFSNKKRNDMAEFYGAFYKYSKFIVNFNDNFYNVQKNCYNENFLLYCKTKAKNNNCNYIFKLKVLKPGNFCFVSKIYLDITEPDCTFNYVNNLLIFSYKDNKIINSIKFNKEKIKPYYKMTDYNYITIYFNKQLGKGLYNMEISKTVITNTAQNISGSVFPNLLNNALTLRAKAESLNNIDALFNYRITTKNKRLNFLLNNYLQNKLRSGKTDNLFNAFVKKINFSNLLNYSYNTVINFLLKKRQFDVLYNYLLNNVVGVNFFGNAIVFSNYNYIGKVDIYYKGAQITKYNKHNGFYFVYKNIIYNNVNLLQLDNNFSSSKFGC